MDESGLDRFGFVAFRAHFGDEGLWKRFQKRYHGLVDEGINSAPAACAEALKRIDDNIIVQFTDDSLFADQGPEGISSAFQICCLEEEVDDEEDGECEDGEEYFQGMTPGVASNMCLMIDEECMKSVSDEVAQSRPFIKAVDARLCDGVDLKYSGWIKVAIDSLIPKFYSAVATYDLADVAAAVVDDGIWTGMGPWDADREYRVIKKLFL